MQPAQLRPDEHDRRVGAIRAPPLLLDLDPSGGELLLERRDLLGTRTAAGGAAVRDRRLLAEGDRVRGALEGPWRRGRGGYSAGGPVEVELAAGRVRPGPRRR